MDKIQRTLLKLNIERWYQDIKESKFAVGFLIVIVLILSWNIYRSSDKIADSKKINGQLVGLHQVQGNLGSSVTMLSIKLENGKNVMVTSPYNLPIKKNEKVEIIEGISEQGYTYYYFSKYEGNK